MNKKEQKEMDDLYKNHENKQIMDSIDGAVGFKLGYETAYKKLEKEHRERLKKISEIRTKVSIEEMIEFFQSDEYRSKFDLSNLAKTFENFLISKKNEVENKEYEPDAENLVSKEDYNVLSFQLSWENAKRMEIPNWLKDTKGVDNVEITFTNKIENSQYAIIKFIDGSYLEVKANEWICKVNNTDSLFINKNEPK